MPHLDVVHPGIPRQGLGEAPEPGLEGLGGQRLRGVLDRSHRHQLCARRSMIVIIGSRDSTARSPLDSLPPVRLLLALGRDEC